MELPSSLTFTVLDTETTGFLPKVDHIIEFASMRVEKGKVVDEFEQLFSIDHEIPSAVQMITRIYPEALQGKPTFEETKDHILSHIGEDTIIVGQNIWFDLKMLAAEGIDLTSRPWLDTSMLASIVFPELASYSLGYLSTVLNLNHAPKHRALGDVRATLELLSACWTRLLELPEPLREIAEGIMKKSPEGYKMLFGALPKSTKKSAPTWLQKEKLNFTVSKVSECLAEEALKKPDIGTVTLIEEPLDPSVLQEIIRRAKADTKTVHWIAVKNLEAVLRRFAIPEGVRIVYPPFLLMQEEYIESFASQEIYTADEATLALKLALYEPTAMHDIPIHGEEQAVWSGKLASTDASKSYLSQFDELPSVILLDHRQLLSFLADEHHSLPILKDAHIVIDDASLLEDTATKSYGWHCITDHLRASAQGNAPLTKFTDLLQIWIERTRNFQDVHYLTPADLGTDDTESLKNMLPDLLKEDLPAPALRTLSFLEKILQKENLPHRIAWIEIRPNGSQILSSVPERISDFLSEHLYKKYPTSLLIPPQMAETLREILPLGQKVTVVPLHQKDFTFPLQCESDVHWKTLLENPPPGKTVVLLGSKRLIEEAYIQNSVALEERGVTFICQSFSGGQGRMQAEFAAAKGDAMWLLTPWAFEGVELPLETIDRLIIATLPFDHPSQTVFSKRAEHYQNSFMEYSIPRLNHRLFRILRTFARYKKEGADIQCFDERLHTKDYGREVCRYLKSLCESDEEEAQEEPKKVMKKKSAPKESSGQLPLF